MQCLQTENNRRGTVRGLHYQIPPNAEPKIIRCVRGAIFDVVVNIRQASRTFRQWHSSKLSEELDLMIYIAAGLAHGYQTLVVDT